MSPTKFEEYKSGSSQLQNKMGLPIKHNFEIHFVVHLQLRWATFIFFKFSRWHGPKCRFMTHFSRFCCNSAAEMIRPEKYWGSCQLQSRKTDFCNGSSKIPSKKLLQENKTKTKWSSLDYHLSRWFELNLSSGTKPWWRKKKRAENSCHSQYIIFMWIDDILKQNHQSSTFQRAKHERSTVQQLIMQSILALLEG